MRTTDLFKNNRSSKRLNESLAKMFGAKLDLENFDTPKLEDARNKLRTQIHSARTETGFNETIENEALTQAQWMHDAIVAELMDRQEHIVDTRVQEGPEDDSAELFNQWMNSEYAPMDDDSGDYNTVMQKAANFLAGQVPDHEISDTAEALTSMFHGEHDDEGGDTDDSYALASAGHGSDEDYEGIEEGPLWKSDPYTRDYRSSVSGMGRRERDWDEGDTEPPNNFAIYINGKKWKVFKGRGYHADDHRERDQLRQLKAMCDKKSAATGKKWEVYTTGEPATESIETESAPPTAKGERMVKHIKKGYAKDGKLTDKEKSIAYATSWKQHNKEKNESINTGDNMHNLREGEIQQASAIVTAKTMVDRVSRWIEELSGMENDTLLQLGDSIRDEMGQEQAKSFISTVAPAIQSALENLKTARETLSSGVRALTGEEQSAEMLGGEPEAGGDMSGDMGADMETPAEPDAMNMGGDEFGAADAAAGGIEAAGREQRESINYQNRLLKVLAG